MKKSCILILLLFPFLNVIKAQIPNSGFEEWISYGNGMNPAGWWSPNDSLNQLSTYFPVTRSTDHYPEGTGMYSIRIESNPILTSLWERTGMVWTGGWTGNNYPAFPVSGHPTSLRGYYKFLPQNGDTVDIHFSLYKNGIEITGGGFKSNQTATEWSLFSADVSDAVYESVDSARIMISACNADNFPTIYGNSVLFVDNLSFENVVDHVNDSERNAHLFRVTPNPSSEIITLSCFRSPGDNLSINIYNVIGKLVKSGKLVQNIRTIETEQLSNGIYIIEVKSRNWSEKQKIVIQH